VRTHAIRTAHENIDRTIKAADGILSQFDLARRVRSLTLSLRTLVLELKSG
jgi:exocyst complex protein 7